MSRAFASIVEFYDALPERAQFVVSWFARALVASVFFSFVSNLATFAYAIKYGARPPVEGVPYLSVTVGLLGFLLIIVTVVTIYGLPLAATQLQRASRAIMTALAPRTPPVGPPTRRRTLASTFIQAMLSSSILMGTISLISLFDRDFLPALFEQYIRIIGRSLVGEVQESSIWLVLAVPIVLSVTAILILGIAALSNKVLQYIANAAYFLAIVTIVALAIHSPFQHASFEHVLRISRFGGGMPVSILLTDGTVHENGYLFITSAEMITLYDSETRRFREINQAHIVEMRYGDSSGWRLPPSRAWDEMWRNSEQRPS